MASPQILPTCGDFFDCPVLSCHYLFRPCAQVEPLDRSSCFMTQTTCFRTRMVLSGLERREIFSQNPPKWAWIGNFKPKRQNIKITIISQNYKSDQDQIWGPTSDQQLHFVGGLTLPRSNPIWLPAAIFKNGYDVITPPEVVLSQPWIKIFHRNLACR